MISKFVRERKKYSQADLCGIFECDGAEIANYIRELKGYGILKATTSNDDADDYSELEDSDIQVSEVLVGDQSYSYFFNFVGVIVAFGRVIKSYPKYIRTKIDPTDEMRQILDVLERYNAKRQIVHLYSANDESKTFNVLALLLFLIDDYYKYGLYTAEQSVIETNGSGEILWEKTINETFAIISDSRPIYTDLKTFKKTEDDNDYFRRLHSCIVTLASKEMEEADLLSIFGIAPVSTSDETIDDLGGKEYVSYMLDRGIKTEFNTRKQTLLKALYAYVNETNNILGAGAFSFFGTTSFNLVWEDVCKECFDNKLERTLRSLPLPVPLKAGYNRNANLVDLISKPFWSASNSFANDTLIPDLVAIDGDYFAVLDAKYYYPILESGKTPKGQPGIESVTKQYLYQLAFASFTFDHGFTVLKNAFVVPTEGEDVLDKGYVSLELMKPLGVGDIEVRFVPATYLYENYLAHKRIPIAWLAL